MNWKTILTGLGLAAFGGAAAVATAPGGATPETIVTGALTGIVGWLFRSPLQGAGAGMPKPQDPPKS